MNVRFAGGLAALALLFASLPAMSQAKAQELTPKDSPFPLPENRPDSSSTSRPSTPEAHPVQALTRPLHFSKTRFVLLSTAVYGAAFADMYQTLQQRNNPGWHEGDPLARPLLRLPAPAYYATGLVMATGLNWLGWKMAHSRRWHKLAPIPQLLAVGGNLNGFRSNVH